MADLNFAQSERRNFAVPAILAFVLVAGIIGGVLHFLPHDTAVVTLPRVTAVPARYNYSSQSSGGVRVLGPQGYEESLYVLPTVSIHDNLHVPLFLKDFTLVYTDASGAEKTISATEKGDLPLVYGSFPALKTMAEPTLLREGSVPPKQTASGTLIFPVPATADEWKQRQSATLHIALYHQPDLTIDLPAGGEIAPAIRSGAAK